MKIADSIKVAETIIRANRFLVDGSAGQVFERHGTMRLLHLLRVRPASPTSTARTPSQ